MNRTEHFLLCLSEECDEVGQRVSKALRFGLREVQKDQPLTNSARIEEELHDLIAVATLLQAKGVISRMMPTVEEVMAKEAKIERYFEISKANGTLQEPSP